MLRYPDSLLLAGLLAAPLMAGCSLAFEYPSAEMEVGALRCSDGLDNDGDGRLDCYDQDCERSAPCIEVCVDGVDNDLDGAEDCADDDCQLHSACVENGDAACSNGLDDDGDGFTDCSDRSCDGSCSEESAGECTDGRDNDGDDLVDGADPRCWPVVPARATRCASVVGGELDESLDGILGLEGAFYVAGTPPAERAPPLLGTVLALESDTTLGTLRTLAGAWDGTEIELLIFGDATIGLAPASTTGVGTPAFASRPFLLVTLEGDSLTVASDSDERTTDLAARDGWQLLRIEIREGMLEGTFSPFPELGTGDPTVLTPLPIEGDAFPDARVLLTGPGVLSRLRITIGTLDPCGAPVPTIDAMDDGRTDVGLDIDAARGADGDVCGFAVACLGSPFATSLTSTDAITWTPSYQILSDASAVAVAWDDVSEQYLAVVSNPVDGELSFFESADCTTWTSRDVSGLPLAGSRYALGPASCADLSAAGLGATLSYVIDDGVHELYWVVGEGASAQLARALSNDAGATFEPAELIPPVQGFGPMLTVTQLGDERVITHLADPVGGELGVRFAVLADGRYLPVPGPAQLPPSGLPGTFDRDAIRSVTLLPSADASASAQLLIGALGDYFAPVSRERLIRFGAATITFGSAPTE